VPDLRSLIPAHREIVERVREMFPEETDETALADTIEGESDLPAAIISVLRAAIEREVTAEALADLIDTMTARKRRFTEGARNLRGAALHTMEEVGLRKLAAPDMTVSVGTTKPRVLITDEAAVPDEFVRITRTPSKTDIAKAMMEGREVPGVTLGNPETHLTIHRR
jgi:hypothetical protein